MRRVPVVAVLTALVLTLSGCLGGGPSNADVSKVHDALDGLGAGWAVEFVDNAGSDSEGIERYLGIGLHHDTRIEPGDLIDLFTLLVEVLPSSYRYDIKILFSVGPEDAFPDLVSQATVVGLNPGYETFYKDGDVWTTVKEMRRIVDEYKP